MPLNWPIRFLSSSFAGSMASSEASLSFSKAITATRDFDLSPNFHPAAIRFSAGLRRLARVEQHAIGGAGRGCAADRMLR